MSADKCLSSDELNLFLKDKMSQEKKAESNIHLSLCQACCHRLATAYKQAQTEPELIRAPRRLTARVLRRPQPRITYLLDWLFDFRRQAVVTTLAAVLLVSSGLAFFLWRNAIPERSPLIADPFRQTAPLSAVSRLLAPENGAEISIEQAEFRWSKVEGIKRYNFTLLDQRGNIVLQTSTTEERLNISTLSERLKQSETYFWYVTTQLPDGTVADSETRKFVLR